MKKILFLTISALTGLVSVNAEPVTYDTTDAVTSINNIETAAVSIMGAFIVLAITIMFYRKIRGVISRG